MIHELNNFKVEKHCGKHSNDKYKIQYSPLNFPFNKEHSELSIRFWIAFLSSKFTNVLYVSCLRILIQPSYITK